MFSNMTFGLGYTRWKSSGRVLVNGELQPNATEFVNRSGSSVNLAIDGNFGYQWIGERVTFQFRYRVFVLVQENALKQTQFTTLHGPEVGVSVHF